MGKTLKTKCLNWAVLAFYTGLSKYEFSGKFEATPKVSIYSQISNSKHHLRNYTWTDKIRSTPLSGCLLHTSWMEAAILMQICLSEMKSINPFGRNTSWVYKIISTLETHKNSTSMSKLTSSMLSKILHWYIIAYLQTRKGTVIDFPGLAK